MQVGRFNITKFQFSLYFVVINYPNKKHKNAYSKNPYMPQGLAREYKKALEKYLKKTI